jgi:hypothetical protein
MAMGIKVIRHVTIAVIWVGFFYSAAYAHGGIAGPDELGPPVLTAAALGIAGYWSVMLWPTRKKSRPDRNRARAVNTGLKRTTTRT